jgi:hypothetical protein
MKIGYKAFNKGLKANNGFQYEIGIVYHTMEPLKFCYNGFHFCEMPMDVDLFYKPSNNTEYAIIEILGDVIYDIEYHNAITNKFRIIKCLSRDELIKCCVGKLVTECGDKFYFKNYKLHRDSVDFPAVIRVNGTMIWYKDGVIHRDGDLPAKIIKGDELWYSNGLLHRDNDKPAVNRLNGCQKWYKNGKLHRESGPAIDDNLGYQHWYNNGKRIEQPTHLYIMTDDIPRYT